MKRLFRFDFFIFAIITLLPTYLIRLPIFGIPTNLLEILISIAFLIALYKQSPFDLFKNSFDKINWNLIGLIFLGLITATITNKNYLSELGIIKGWFFFPIILAMLAKKELSKEKIYFAIYISAASISLLSVIYYINNMLTFDGRLVGIFNSPNYLAMFLAPSLLVGFSNLNNALKQRNNFITWAYILSLATILFSIYQSHSYATWASLVIVFLILGAFHANKNIKLKRIFFISLLCIILIALQWNTKKFQDLTSFSNRSSTASRVMIWTATTKILSDNWFFGIGPGNFQEKYLLYQQVMPEPYLEWAVPHPHNLFLAFWLQAGLIGLISFLILIGRWMIKLFRQPKNSLSILAFSIMLYFLIHGLVDTTYFKNDLAILFWLNFIAIL